MRTDIYDFYALGLGEPFSVICARDWYRDVLMPSLNLPTDRGARKSRCVIKFSLIGRLNGKSSLISAILGEDRVIASPVAGTTRDAIDTYITDAEGQEYTMIDTAGNAKIW